MSDIFAGYEKVNIKKLFLTSLLAQKGIDISGIVRNIDIFQSIFSPVTTGRIRVIDATGLSSIPIIGQEIVDISFETPNREEFSRFFFVYGIEDQEYNDNGAAISFTLKLASIDHFKGLGISIKRGVKKTINEIVKDILEQDLGTSYDIHIENTKGVERIIFPNWSIWECIEYLRKRASSIEYITPFLFFEDQNGYHFLSYEKLIEERKKLADELRFVNEPFKPGAGEGETQTTVLPSQFRNMTNFKIIKKANAAEILSNGGLRSETILYDPYTRETTVNKYTYSELVDKIKKPLSDKFYPEFSSDFVNTVTETNGRRVLFIDNNDNFINEQTNFGDKEIFIQCLNNTVVGFMVPGDSQLQPGDIIFIEGPERSTAEEKDKTITGRYIIGDLRHGILDGMMLSNIEAYRFGFNEEVIPNSTQSTTEQDEVLTLGNSTVNENIVSTIPSVVTQSNTTDIVDRISSGISNSRSVINNISSHINTNISTLIQRIPNIQNILTSSITNLQINFTDINTAATQLSDVLTSLQIDNSQLQNLVNILQNTNPDYPINALQQIKQLLENIEDDHSTLNHNLIESNSQLNDAHMFIRNISSVENRLKRELEGVGLNV